MNSKDASHIQTGILTVIFKYFTLNEIHFRHIA